MSDRSFEELLETEGRLIYTNVGTSMLPLIRQGKDLLIIQRPDGRLKKYDIPLYRRDSGQYVLHRVLKVRESDYVLCGDHQWHRETGITDRHVIGVLKAVVREGKEAPLSGWKYRLYVSLWCDLFPIRAFLLRSACLLRRIMSER